MKTGLLAAFVTFFVQTGVDLQEVLNDYQNASSLFVQRRDAMTNPREEMDRFHREWRQKLETALANASMDDPARAWTIYKITVLASATQDHPAHFEYAQRFFEMTKASPEQEMAASMLGHAAFELLLHDKRINSAPSVDIDAVMAEVTAIYESENPAPKSRIIHLGTPPKMDPYQRDYPTLLRWYARELGERGRSDEAIAMYLKSARKLQELDPDRDSMGCADQTLHKAGIFAARKNRITDLEKVLAALNEVRQNQSKYDRGWVVQEIVKTLPEPKDPEARAKLLRQIAADNAGNTDSWQPILLYELGKKLCSLQRYQEALPLLEQALETDPFKPVHPIMPQPGQIRDHAERLRQRCLDRLK
ncbi:MAG: hypothetical protein AAGK14_12530 [Verrucomicrobiota bacterium]